MSMTFDYGPYRLSYSKHIASKAPTNGTVVNEIMGGKLLPKSNDSHLTLLLFKIETYCRTFILNIQPGRINAYMAEICFYQRSFFLKLAILTQSTVLYRGYWVEPLLRTPYVVNLANN